jgi:predicted GNAT family acetyltransferase
MDIKVNGNTVTITTSKDEDPLDRTYIEKAFKHWEYLKTYRKGYSKKRKAKNMAVKEALRKKGVDVEALEKEAVKSLK